jgi:hypothetical protein
MRPIQLDSDHFKLNKFRSFDDPNYVLVSSNVCRIAIAALEGKKRASQGMYQFLMYMGFH